MMATYDTMADVYAAFVTSDLGDQSSVLATATREVLKDLGPIEGAVVCDLACGEGHLTRQLAERGATAIGIDRSMGLLTLARRQTVGTNPSYLLDDAQALASVRDESVDLVVCNLSLMDIPDLAAVYATVHRISRPAGRFVFSMTHPCFQSPESEDETDEQGQFAARSVKRYMTEGFWQSTFPDGIRGRVGAYHRTLSTYLNQLIGAGFMVRRITEPVVSPIDRPVPSVLVIDAEHAQWVEPGHTTL